jgi:hypothetical protein
MLGAVDFATDFGLVAVLDLLVGFLTAARFRVRDLVGLWGTTFLDLLGVTTLTVRVGLLVLLVDADFLLSWTAIFLLLLTAIFLDRDGLMTDVLADRAFVRSVSLTGKPVLASYNFPLIVIVLFGIFPRIYSLNSLW